MRRPKFSTPRRALALCCLLTLATLPACVKLARHSQPSAEIDAREVAQTEQPSVERVNINRASREELERLPGVGPALAVRIVEHRERNGPFRRAEHLLLVRGISDASFRQLRPLIEVD